MGESPELSVVVALISGKVEHLRACLHALVHQSDPPAMEILVPYDRAVAEVTELGAEFPAARFLLAEGLDTKGARAGASREHHDTLRTLGLRAARGRVVALTEDHAVVSETWAADMVGLLDAHPTAAAIGGAVECRSDRLLNWAVYYCDFGRYQNPLPKGPAEFVSDSNVAYRREALEAIAEAWEADYHETVVHGALAERGHELWLHPGSRVWQARGRLRLRDCLRERYVWGRSFAGTRARGMSGGQRVLYSGASIVLPFLLTGRIMAGALARRRLLVRLATALPLVFLLEAVWAAGEWTGYTTSDPSRPRVRRRTG